MFWMLAFASMTRLRRGGPLSRGVGVVVRVRGAPSRNRVRHEHHVGIVQRRQTGSMRDIFSQSRDPPTVFNPAAARMSEGALVDPIALSKTARRPRCRRPLDMREAGDRFAAASGCELGGKSTAIFAAESLATTTKVSRVKMWQGRVFVHCQARGRLLRDRSCPSRRLASSREAHVGRASACRPCCRR